MSDFFTVIMFTELATFLVPLEDFELLIVVLRGNKITIQYP